MRKLRPSTALLIAAAAGILVIGSGVPEVQFSWRDGTARALDLFGSGLHIDDLGPNTGALGAGVSGAQWSQLTQLLKETRAVLRRAGDSQPSAKVLKAADIVLDRDTRTVRVAKQFVDLTPSEFDILTALMTSPGRVYSRLDLLDIIQGVRYEGYERTIDTHIKNLRSKIETNPRDPRYIETVYGVGYRFKRG